MSQDLHTGWLVPATLLCDASYQDPPKFLELTGLDKNGAKAQLVEVELLHAQASAVHGKLETV